MTRDARALARVAVAFGALATVALAVVVVLLASEGRVAVQATGDLAMLLAFTAVGSLVLLRRPENLVGWAMWVAGVGLVLGGVLSGYGELAVLARPESGLPRGLEAAALAEGSWTALMAGVFLLIVTFPSGRLASRRVRRWATLVLLGFALVWVGVATAPTKLSAPFGHYENPLAVTQSDLWFAFIALIPPCLVSVGVACVLAVRRFRRSRGVARQQFKWLAASAGLLGAILPFAAAFNYTGAAGIAITVAVTALPVSVGIAILRYRLYEIDRVISRTLVYSLLTVILGAAYAGLVLAGQAVFSSFAGGGDLAIAGSTLVVAALFLPARSRVQAFVDRRFYRRRYDAKRTLEAFGARLREQVDLASLAADLRGVVDQTMQPTHSSLWLRSRT